MSSSPPSSAWERSRSGDSSQGGGGEGGDPGGVVATSTGANGAMEERGGGQAGKASGDALSLAGFDLGAALASEDVGEVKGQLRFLHDVVRKACLAWCDANGFCWWASLCVSEHVGVFRIGTSPDRGLLDGVPQAVQQETMLDELYTESLRMVDNNHKLAMKLIDKVGAVYVFLCDTELKHIFHISKILHIVRVSDV